MAKVLRMAEFNYLSRSYLLLRVMPSRLCKIKIIDEPICNQLTRTICGRRAIAPTTPNQ
ncbi:MAG: hypothetical protein ACRC1Z_13850 [Waterburya sp.]